jgi:hypothetical protein
MTPQFYFEHYYIWGYAAFSTVAFVVASYGAVVLLRRRRTFDTILLVSGTLGVIASRCISDVGWLVLSEGSGGINYLVHPEREPILDMIGKISEILYFYGVLVLALWMPMLLRVLAQSPTESNKNQKAEQGVHGNTH